MRRIFGGLATVAVALSIFGAATASASKGKTTYTVCKHGCKYKKIQKAVDAVKKGSKSVVAIKPGTYAEGVEVIGHKYNGLTIKGTGKNPGKVVLNGKHAHVNTGGGTGLAQFGVEGEDVNNLKVLNLHVENYATNGIFIHAADQTDETCHGFKMKNDWASFNKSYGLFAKHCTGGSITDSRAWGHGDSGIYIGETPPQGATKGAKPKWTDIGHNVLYKNVLGYSGTNSKYVDLHDNVVYNNGAGIVPNTLDSEDFQPAATGKVRKNEIFWNNFDYYKPDSPVKSVGGLGGGSINYPTGIGVALFGTTGWKVYDNKIFGNFMWGVAQFSDPSNSAALNQSNQVYDNTMGRGGNDTNRYDLFNDGSGGYNCFSGNHSSTKDVQAGSSQGSLLLYPSTCPNTVAPPVGGGTGNEVGDGVQVGELAAYVYASPPCNQEQQWVVHSHPKYKNYKPYSTPGDCA